MFVFKVIQRRGSSGSSYHTRHEEFWEVWRQSKPRMESQERMLRVYHDDEVIKLLPYLWKPQVRHPSPYLTSSHQPWSGEGLWAPPSGHSVYYPLPRVFPPLAFGPKFIHPSSKISKATSSRKPFLTSSDPPQDLFLSYLQWHSIL